jgi:7-cyano-7-deazaguanine synthase
MKRVRHLPCLVLASGGIDSTACLSYYRERGQPLAALFVDYGQPARSMEAQAVRAVCGRLKVPLRRLQVTGLNIPPGEIRGRNALLLVVGLMNLDEDVGLVSLGIHAGTSYPDCSPLFLSRVQEIYDSYCAGQVQIDAPFATWSKRDVYDFAMSRKLPLDLTYSCLRGGKKPCGECESCKDVEALHAR